MRLVWSSFNRTSAKFYFYHKNRQQKIYIYIYNVRVQSEMFLLKTGEQILLCLEGTHELSYQHIVQQHWIRKVLCRQCTHNKGNRVATLSIFSTCTTSLMLLRLFNLQALSPDKVIFQTSGTSIVPKYIQIYLITTHVYILSSGQTY